MLLRPFRPANNSLLGLVLKEMDFLQLVQRSGEGDRCPFRSQISVVVVYIKCPSPILFLHSSNMGSPGTAQWLDYPSGLHLINLLADVSDNKKLKGIQ